MNPAVVSGSEGGKNKMTHRPCKVTIKFLDDSRKAPTGHVQKLPATSHGSSIPTRRRMLLHSSDVTFLLMVKVKLKETPKFIRVGEEKDYPACGTHEC